MPSLFVIRGNDQGTRFELEDPSQGIGRDATNHIQLHDTEVSRRHAEIRIVDKDYLLIDLGSSNGTHVNNRRIAQHVLESGDEVRIGGSVMLYTGPGEEPMNLFDRIDIVSAQQKTDEHSRIVSSLSHKPGSGLFDPGQLEGQSPWLKNAMSNLDMMYRTVLAVSHTLDIDQLLSKIMQLIFEWVECDRGCILLANNDTRKLDRKAVRHRQGISDQERIRISHTIVDYVTKHGEGVLTTDAQEDSRFDSAASLLRHNVREAVCVPMQGRHNNMVGLIYIDTLTPPEHILTHGTASKFSEEHLKLMIAIGHQAAMAVEDTRYYGELMQAERLAAVGQTIATLSHHIKNILQGIRGGSYLIEMGLKSQEKMGAGEEEVSVEKFINHAGVIRKGWDIVDKNQKKISNLVMDMLTFSKEREPALEPAHLNQVTHDVFELMESRAKENEVDITCELDTKMPTLVFDPEGLHRAILNVATNAIDASANQETRRGAVKLSTEYIGTHARVVVEDNGTGIPPEEVEKIFILFNSSKKGGRGTGLGLSVSNKIIHEHGGKIIVESKVGKGSRFILQIPSVVPTSREDGGPTSPDIRGTSPSGFPKPLNKIAGDEDGSSTSNIKPKAPSKKLPPPNWEEDE